MPTQKPTHPEACPGCGTVLDAASLAENSHVCDCGRHFRISAATWIELLADPGTWRERWRDLQPRDFLGWREPVPYDRLIRDAQERGHDEAVRAGTCAIGGHEVCLAVFDFSFLGGTLGVVAGERLARTMEHAAGHRRPCVVVSASGGARMQEGALALMQMAKVNATVRMLREAGVPYLSVLTDPTFGGTSASLALIGDVNVAEPASAIGFTGARVIKQATHGELPPGFQTAEFNLARGQVDMVVARPELRQRLVDLLDLYAAPWTEREAGNTAAPAPVPPAGDGTSASADAAAGADGAASADGDASGERAWSIVELARHEERPYAGDYIRRWTDLFIELHGDRLTGDDPALVAGIGRWNGAGVVFLGQQKARTFAERVRRNFGMMHPEGYRKATRVARQAARFGFPIVVLVDTPGAYPGAGAEERGIASAIGTSIVEWFEIDTPVVAAVIGEGGSGGALGVATADRVLMLEHAIYSVAMPEAASSIVWKDSAKKQAAARQLSLAAPDLCRLGVVDTIVPEPPAGAHRDHDAAARLLGGAVWAALEGLRGLSGAELVARRRLRFREMGNLVLVDGDGGPAPLSAAGPGSRRRP